MAHKLTELTDVISLRADALGNPGQRTFHLLVESKNCNAVIWLEKEQLFELALTLKELIATVPENSTVASPITESHEDPVPQHIEFKLGRLGLGYDKNTGWFTIEAHDDQSIDKDLPKTRIWVRKNLLSDFSEQALRICAAGRPLCVLCDKPIEPNGHKCARANGHNIEQVSEL